MNWNNYNPRLNVVKPEQRNMNLTHEWHRVYQITFVTVLTSKKVAYIFCKIFMAVLHFKYISSWQILHFEHVFSQSDTGSTHNTIPL